MYYHVRITTKSNPTEDIVKLDLDEERLLSRFVNPYITGKAIFTEGRNIPYDDVYQIRLNETEEDSSILIRRIMVERRVGGFGPTNSNEWMVTTKGRNVTDDYISGPPLIFENPVEEPDDEITAGNNNVFVIHGRNIQLRNAMFSFLRSIGLHPIEWSEAVRGTGKTNPYVGEILDVAFERANVIVALMTPDDEGKLRGEFLGAHEQPHDIELTPQARLNVIFEAGMAMGRDENRTIIIEVGNPRPFSDIGGRHVIRMDNSSQKRQDLAQRLEMAGCEVSLNGRDWHTEGNFELLSIESERDDDLAHRIL